MVIDSTCLATSGAEPEHRAVGPSVTFVWPRGIGRDQETVGHGSTTRELGLGALRAEAWVRAR